MEAPKNKDDSLNKDFGELEFDTMPVHSKLGGDRLNLKAKNHVAAFVNVDE